MRIAIDAPVVESWRLGYLIDIIYLRDLWMHRIDTARATGAELVLTPEHDGVIVADVVAEWARRHQQPFTLELTGAAGGSSPPGTMVRRSWWMPSSSARGSPDGARQRACSRPVVRPAAVRTTGRRRSGGRA